MIVLDSSALLAVLKGEAMASACARVLGDQQQMVISAVTLAETLMVARTANVAEELEELLAAFPIDVAPVDGEAPWRIQAIHLRYGKGNHPARLNIVDCFSYDLAHQLDCPLLYIGNDFGQTDIGSALA